jgi:hypothetical protein
MEKRVIRKIVPIMAAGLLLGSTALGFAQSQTQDQVPGQRMQERGSAPGQGGTSGNAPSPQRKQEKGSTSGQGGTSGAMPGATGSKSKGSAPPPGRDSDER